jgi:hypothetical protein
MNDEALDKNLNEYRNFIARVNEYLKATGEAEASELDLIRHNRVSMAVKFAETPGAYAPDPVLWACAAHGVQNCSFCKNFACCDNTNPEKPNDAGREKKGD